MSYVAVSVRGKVREIGAGKLPELFEKNPYMFDIYPDEKSRSALTVFQLYEGSGEWFDLSKKPIERASFSVGGIKESDKGYYITNKCMNCRACGTVCLQYRDIPFHSCIDHPAFCCISTGAFHFPNEEAAEIAVRTENEFIAERQSEVKVIFNVFKESDYKTYRRLLCTDEIKKQSICINANIGDVFKSLKKEW